MKLISKLFFLIAFSSLFLACTNVYQRQLQTHVKPSNKHAKKMLLVPGSTGSMIVDRNGMILYTTWDVNADSSVFQTANLDCVKMWSSTFFNLSETSIEVILENYNLKSQSASKIYIPCMKKNGLEISLSESLPPTSYYVDFSYLNSTDFKSAWGVQLHFSANNVDYYTFLQSVKFCNDTFYSKKLDEFGDYYSPGSQSFVRIPSMLASHLSQCLTKLGHKKFPFGTL